MGLVRGAYNTDLANNLGNLVNRVTAMARPLSRRRACGGAGAPDACSRADDDGAADYSAAMDALALDRGVPQRVSG